MSKWTFVPLQLSLVYCHFFKEWKTLIKQMADWLIDRTCHVLPLKTIFLQRTVDFAQKKTFCLQFHRVFHHTGWKCLPSLNPPVLETNSVAECLSVSKIWPHSRVQGSRHILLASDMELHLFCWFISSAKTISEHFWDKVEEKIIFRHIKNTALLFCSITLRNNKS